MSHLATGWWSDLSLRDKRQIHVLALAMVAFLVHYAILSFWFVEDAAITFSFAHNAATGEGFVAWPGGERVEGFSNPTWTLLLMATEWLTGLDPNPAAKLYGGLFGLVTLPLSLVWARWVMGERDDIWPALVPLALALSPQFTLWCGSGLENPLFIVLLTAGSVLLLREVDAQRFPWSALAFSLLAFTRPEAPMYPAVAATVGAGWILGRRGLRGLAWWTWRWAALFLAPLLAWHIWRYLYFAWEFPNTYYAKLGDGRRTDLVSWNKKGWSYLRRYALHMGQGFLVPVYLLGATGMKGRARLAVGLGVCTVLLVLVVPGLDWARDIPGWPFPRNEPDWWEHSRLGFLVALVALPLVGLGRPGAAGRTLAWLLTAASMFFALVSGGDWMDSFRLLSFCIVPLMVLFADGAATLYDALRDLAPAGARAPTWVLGAVAAVPLVMGPVGTGTFLTWPETMPFDVHRRVAYKQEQARRMHLDHVVDAEVDMGAHMWWGRFETVDMPGLIDVPMGRHKWEKPFVREYIFEERRPHLVHSHGGWASKTRLQTHPEFRRLYVEIPPYPVSPWSQHPGNWVRRDLFMEQIPRPIPTALAGFEDVVDLLGWEVPAPQVTAGHSLYLEVRWRRGTHRQREFRPLVFLARSGEPGPPAVVAELPPAYDWLRPKKWRRTEAARGRHTVALPDDLPEGSYDLGVLVLREGGGVVPVRHRQPGAVITPVRLGEGEIRWEGVVEVVSFAEAQATADRELASALVEAESGQCEAAEEWWAQARRHLRPEHPWQREARETLDPLVARCWARAAQGQPRAVAVESIREARRWDHRQSEVVEIGAALADEWQGHGETLLEAGDLDEAYGCWRDALYADPRRSWLRRRTEDLRDRRLGIREYAPDDDDDDDQPEIDVGGD